MIEFGRRAGRPKMGYEGRTRRRRSIACVFSPAITPYFKLPLPSNSNLDLISILEFQGFDNGCGEPDG
jgi:hypothetical protein